MKFLSDENVYLSTIRLLGNLGHEVVTVNLIGLCQTADDQLLDVAQRQLRIFLTRDRDFGKLVFAGGRDAGVIYLRMLPSTQNAVHAELERVLKLYDEQELREWFIVVESGRHRIRKPRP